MDVWEKIGDRIMGDSSIETISFVSQINKSFMLQCPWEGNVSCLLLMHLHIELFITGAFSNCPKEDRSL